MSLRSKLLTLFVVLAVLPMVALGAYGYLQSLQALEALLGRQTSDVVDQAARALEQQVARQDAYMLLLAENAETQELYRVSSGAGGDAARARVDTFVTSAWQRFGDRYRSLELRDAKGVALYRAGNGLAAPAPSARTVPVVRPVRDVDSGVPRGSLVLEASLDGLLPRELLERRVGEQGYSVVIDRGAGTLLFHPRPGVTGQSLARLSPDLPWTDTSALAAPRGTFRYGSGDSARMVSFASLASPPWTILSIASIAEFAPPFERARSVQLAMVLLLTATITTAFVQLLRRTTRSLEELTVAADAVGRGNLDPKLPAVDGDEVGRLSRAFETMVHRVRDMIAQVESSRQMAVLGEFASQVAHEIRNPLTSIKLNLQGLARDARSGQLPAPTAASVDICLLEIDRLDGVVGGVLTLAQTGPVLLTSCRVHGIVREAVRLVGAQASAQSVLIEVDLRAEADVVSGDATRLQGALLNLLLNALAAMPGGGTLRVATESTGTDVAASLLRLHVIDTGSGIRPGDQERIFRPFHTTRTGGTGLGLPIARRTVEAHGGRLTLVERPAGARGAEFLIELPLASPPADMTTESASAREPGRDV